MIRSTNNIYINSIEPSAVDYLELLKIKVIIGMKVEYLQQFMKNLKLQLKLYLPYLCFLKLTIQNIN